MERLATENQLAKSFWQWVCLKTIRQNGVTIPLNKVMFHIANEGKRTPQEGKRLKECGLVKGVNDYCLDVPVDPYHGLYFDLKVIGKKATKEQKEFAQIRKLMGYYADPEVQGLGDAIKLVEDYLSGDL